MKVECLCLNNSDAITYIITKDNETIIIDPANPLDVIKRYVGDNKVVAILLTHGHYDHFHELRPCLDYYQVKCYMHQNSFKKVNSLNLSCAYFFNCSSIPEIKEDEVVKISSDSNIKINNFNIMCIQLPGHTSCSIGYIIDGDAFFGDCLFVNSIGRFDLPTGSYPASMDSLKKIKSLIDKGTLNPSMVVYSGHDEPFTFSEALRANPYFKVK